MKIPVFESNSRLGAMPSVRQSNAGATPDSFGAIQGQAVSRLGQELAQIGGEMRSRQDKIASKEAFVKASDQLRVFLHDPETGAYAKQGVNAKGLLDSSDSQLEKIHNDSVKNLTPMQREMFESFWASQRESALTGLARHESNQMADYEDKTDAAIVAGAEGDMATHFMDPEAMKSDRAIADSTIRSTAKRRGWGADITEKELQVSRSRGYGAVIARFLADDKPEEAKKVLDAHGDEIIDEVKRDLDEKIKTYSVKLKVQSIVDTLAPLGTPVEKEEEALMTLDKDYQAGKINLTEYTKSKEGVMQQFSNLRHLADVKEKSIFSQGMKDMRSAGSYAEAKKIADMEEDPEAMLLLQAGAKSIYSEQYQQIENSRSRANQISNQLAYQTRLEQDRDVKDTALQNAMTSMYASAGSSDPAVVIPFIKANYSGTEENNLLRAFDGDRISAGRGATKVDDTPAYLQGAAVSKYMTEARRVIDASLRAGKPMDAEESQRILLKQIPAEIRNSINLSEADMKSIANYGTQNGVAGLVQQSDVLAAYQASQKNPAKSVNEKVDTDRMEANHPGLFDATLRALGSPEKKPTADQIKKVVAELILQESGGMNLADQNQRLNLMDSARLKVGQWDQRTERFLQKLPNETLGRSAGQLTRGRDSYATKQGAIEVKRARDLFGPKLTSAHDDFFKALSQQVDVSTLSDEAIRKSFLNFMNNRQKKSAEKKGI